MLLARFVPGEQVLAVVGIEEFAERLDAADHHQEIVLTFKREHGIDEIVPRALLAQLDFQTVGEEGEDQGCSTELVRNRINVAFEKPCNGLRIFEKCSQNFDHRLRKRFR